MHVLKIKKLYIHTICPDYTKKIDNFDVRSINFFFCRFTFFVVMLSRNDKLYTKNIHGCGIGYLLFSLSILGDGVRHPMLTASPFLLATWRLEGGCH